MHGGPSQVDTFDYKPLLQRDHGKPLPFERPRVVSSETFNLLKSPWEFKQHGESGLWVSELFPHVAKCVDDLCVINSMYGSKLPPWWGAAELHTGSDTFVRPSMGSWINYGLGSENQNMPGFITICPTLTTEVRTIELSFFSGLPRHSCGNAGVSARQAKSLYHESRGLSRHSTSGA
jgi:hypothetical protein